MPTVRAQRSIATAADELWALVSDPHGLPRWWPTVTRVEDVTDDAWTAVLSSPRGRPVRADYTLLDSDPPRHLGWRHEVAESPFERVLAGAIYELELQPERAGTRVRLIARLRLRGFARLGGLLVVRATRRQLDEALAGLARTTEG